jgi:acetyl esterase/lipase
MNHANRWVRAGLTGAMALLALSAAAADLLKPLEVNAIPASPPDRAFTYGSDANQIGQLFLPQGRGPFPVAVVIHGGCWKKFADLKNRADVRRAQEGGHRRVERRVSPRRQ